MKRGKPTVMNLRFVSYIGCLTLFLSIFGNTSAFASGSQAPQFWNQPHELSSQPGQPTTLFDRLKSLDLSPLRPSETHYDESFNFQPGLNLYNEAAQLTDLFGTHGSQLCGPIAITHSFMFLKYFRKPNFPGLPTYPDMAHDGTTNTYRDAIRYFYQICKTDKETGTFYSEMVNCMRQYISYSTAYTPWVYMIGPHATEAPPGYPLESVQHVLTAADVRQYASAGVTVLMGVGWYELNATTHQYTRTGGHFFDVYGYDYSKSWGENGLILKAVNSWVDYTGRAPAQMYDDVTMLKLPTDGTVYPKETAFMLSGPGFQFDQKAFVEDIFVAVPAAK